MGEGSCCVVAPLPVAQTLPFQPCPSTSQVLSSQHSAERVGSGLDQGEGKQIWGELKREVMSGVSRKELLTLAWICEQ